MPSEIKATPQQPALGAIARLLKGREELQQRVPSMTGTILDLLLPTSQTVEKWSYGDPLVRIPQQSNIPIIPDKAYTLESAAFAPMLGPVAKATKGLPVGAIIKPKGGAGWLAGQLSPKSSVSAFKDADAYQRVTNLERDRLRTNEPAAYEELKDFLDAEFNRSPFYNAKDQFDVLNRWKASRGEPPLTIDKPDEAVNKWVETKLAKYVTNEMATPEDPLRKLAEENILHYQPLRILPNSRMANTITASRELTSNPVEGLGLSDLAKRWEDTSDYAITPMTARDRLYDLEARRTINADAAIEQNPWLKQVDPKSMTYTPDAYGFIQSNERLGFPHMVDELRNAVDPASTLPAHLRLTPKQLENLEMPNAVKLVDKINKYRAAEAIKAEKAGMMANLQAEPRLTNPDFQLSFVDKPGSTWINVPETVDKNGVQLCTTIGKQGGWCTMDEPRAKEYGSGRNRLVAMVDADGRPHLQATISQPSGTSPSHWMNILPEEEQIKILESGITPGDLPEYKEWLAQRPANITEFKPPGNSFDSDRAKKYAERDPEYKQKLSNSVLDFLNSQQWGTVSDIERYGIIDIQNPNSVLDQLRSMYGSKNRQPGIDAFNAAVGEDPYAPRFMRRGDFVKFLESYGPIEGNAQGGVVGMAGGGLFGLVSKYTAKKGLGERAADAALKTTRTARDEAIIEASKAAKKGFLEPSKEKDVWYHGTRADIKEFKPGERGAIFLTRDKDFANEYAPTSQMLFLGELPNHPNVMPVHVQVRNPFDYENPEHIQAVLDKAKLPKAVDPQKIRDNLELGNWNYIEDKNIQKAIKDLGFDGFYIKEQGVKNLGVYDSRQIKSAIGMQGNYDITNPDIGMAKGGLFQRYDTGGQISTTSQNAALGFASKILKEREELQKRYPTMTGAMLDFMLPTAKTVEKWSYGDPLFRMAPSGTGSRIPMTVRDKEYVAETLGYAPIGVPAKAAAAGIMMTPPIGAIKPKGGNWLAGQVEKAVAPLRPVGPTHRDEALMLGGEWGRMVDTPEAQRQIQQNDAVSRWLDQKLTKYIKKEMATPEDPLRLQADRWATEQQPKLLAEKQAQLDKAVADFERARVTRGQPPEELTRSRARILELEKERDFIAARTGLHAVPREQSMMSFTKENRALAGFPREGMATTPAGKRWEDLADIYLANSDAAGGMTKKNYWLRESDAERILTDNPWLLKVPPETMVYRLNAGVSQQDTGFKHMVDELRNAMNSESGLPKELQITAKDLDKMTVPQVAELVDKINAHRAVQKAEADALAAQKSIEVYKEYPESEKGLRWVEMKLLDNGKLPEGYTVTETKVPGTLAVRDAEGKQVALGKSEDDAVRNFFKRNPELMRKDLEEALKYEGDVMQHCVGGYCPDVVSGKSRIFSLRDSSGRPHATIEVVPVQRYNLSLDIKPYMAEAEELAKQLPNGYFQEDVYSIARDLAAKNAPMRIEQIKGYKNEKPAEDVIPFVQDFVKSQKWSSVGDMQHTDLIALKPKQLANARARGFDVDVIAEIGDQPYVSKIEFNRLIDLFNPTNAPEPKSHGGAVGMALGGLVAKYAEGGLVNDNPLPLAPTTPDFTATAQKYDVQPAPMKTSSTLTPERAKQLMWRNMTVGVPDRIFNMYGGYDAVKAAYDATGGGYNLNNIPANQLTRLANQVANTGQGNLNALSYAAVPLQQPAITALANTGFTDDQLLSRNLPTTTGVMPFKMPVAPPTTKPPKLLPPAEMPAVNPSITPKIAKSIVQRMMTTNDMPESVLQHYGGYDAIKAYYDRTNGNYSLDAISPGQMQRYANRVADTGKGNLSILRYANKPLSETATTALSNLGLTDAELWQRNMPNTKGELPPKPVVKPRPAPSGGGGGISRKTLDDLASAYSMATFFVPGLQLAAPIHYALKGLSLANTAKKVGKWLGFEEGGAVKYDPDEINKLVASIAPEYDAGGLVRYDPTEIDTIVSRVKEELHA